MIRSSVLAAAAGCLLLSGVPGAHALTFATDVWWFDNGSSTEPERRDPQNALGADNKPGTTGVNFLSLGMTGAVTGDGQNRTYTDPGAAVFSFGTAFGGSGTVYEITNGACTNDGGACNEWPEQVGIWAGQTFDGIFDGDWLDTFTYIDSLGNFETQGGGTFSMAGPFTYLALVDETVLLSGLPNFIPNGDGFEVNAVSISAVPVPSALLLLGSAIAGVGFLSRRRKPRVYRDGESGTA